jgi:replication factor A1
MSLDDHAEELASDLGVDKEEVKADLENLVEYSVPVDEAKQSLRRKYGDSGGGSGGGPSKVDVADVTTDDGNVTVTGKVLTVGKRSIRYQGNEQVIHEGEIGDETGTISYTAWEDFGLSAGDVITAGNAGVREWEGEPELNLGESTNVAFEDEMEVPYDVGGDAGLVDLEPGDRGINLEVEVLEVETKTIDGRDGETTISSGVLADETGRLPFTDWEARAEIEEGATIRLEDVYVREFRGVPSVNLSEFTEVSPLGRDIETSDTATRMTVRDAVATGGAYDVEVVANVVAVRDGSGLIERCPECGRVIQNGQCRSHGDVDGQDDLRVKAILDDGTGTVTAVLDDERTAEVYGGDVEDAKAQARDAMDKEVVADAIRDRIVGPEFRVRGNLSVDDYGANLEVTAFEQSEESPADRAESLLAEVAE